MDLSETGRARFRQTCEPYNETSLARLTDAVAESLGPGPHLDYNAFLQAIEAEAKRGCVKLTATRKKLLQNSLARRDEAAAPVIKKAHKRGAAQPDPLHGIRETTTDGTSRLVEYEPDPELRDTEQVPLLEEGGVEAFMQREVLPHAVDAWVAEGSDRIGYEINFNRHFYKPKPLRSLEEIRADIDALEKETEGLLQQILVETDSR